MIERYTELVMLRKMSVPKTWPGLRTPYVMCFLCSMVLGEMLLFVFGDLLTITVNFQHFDIITSLNII